MKVVEKQRITWLMVHPTPYNSHLLACLRASRTYDLRVYYVRERVQHLNWGESGDGKVLQLRRDWRLILSVLTSPDLVIFTGWADVIAVIGLLIRRLRRLPYGFWTDSVKSSHSKRFLNGAKNKFKHWLLKKACIVFTTGDFGVRRMIASGLFNDKARLFSLPFFVPIPEEITQLSVPTKEEINLLILSRLIERKGIDVAIRSIKVLKDTGLNARLYIGGTGPLDSKLKGLVTSLGLDSHVIFLGWLDETAKIEIRKQSHFALHPVTEMDPYPLVVLESLAMGLPVIGSILAGSVADRVVDGVNGYEMRSSSVKEVAEVIRRAVNEATRYQQMCINARTMAAAWDCNKARQLFEHGIESVLK